LAFGSLREAFSLLRNEYTHEHEERSQRRTSGCVRRVIVAVLALLLFGMYGIWTSDEF